MVKVIMGLKGAGKTKQMIDLVNAAIDEEKGSVICVERGKKLTYDINYKARLIDTKAHYSIKGYEMLKGFICGLYSGNYDISHIFIDSLTKVANTEDLSNTGDFIQWLEDFGKENNVRFTITISAAQSDAPEDLKQFIA